ncbi:MAG TPA: penicillin acylase family protein, partial [Bacteroidia bacterium]|nr:penicillin acylase family protein [Bacteroidia bacterium]
NLPFKIWMGSNAWVVSANRSSSGKVLFENDTHIGHQLPAVWYEAHLECPGFSFYGNFLAGFPFAPIGHSRRHAWGLTIFENDDLDFFVEKADTTNPNRIWVKDHWENLTLREEIIHVKNKADIKILCRSSHHGPICSDVMSDFKDVTSSPVAACWTFLREQNNLMEVTYDLAHATSMENFRAAVSQISAPGLNVLYGDLENNIAWWTAAKIVKRAPDSNPALLLDGSTGKDDWLGYYSFSENPRSENPPNGYVYSTNNQPDSVNHTLYPGYYLPEDRAVRVTQLLNSRGVFDVLSFQQINTDVINPVAAGNAKLLTGSLSTEIASSSPTCSTAVAILENWNGSHRLEDAAPTVYYRWLYEVLHRTFEDEMGEKDFEAFLKTHIQKSTVAPFLKLKESVWYDDIHTTSKTENKSAIVNEAFLAAIGILSDKLGKDPAKWNWKRVHSLEFEHPLGKQKPLDKFFNRGPYPVMGGVETVNNQSFNLTSDYRCKSNLGPALRRILDFSDPEHGLSINPTGQSGNFMSSHYSDQADLYIRGEFRQEMMNQEEIIHICGDALVLEPVK